MYIIIGGTVMNEVIVTEKNFEEEILKSEKPVLVDFWADWCGPCKMLAPIMDDIASEREDIKVCKVNIDDEMNLALKYNVMSIPTIIAFTNGEIKNRTVGVQSKSDIIALLD